MSEIVWEDPPSSERGGGRSSRDWGVFEDELRAHPGKWALMYMAAKTAGHGGHRRTVLRERGFDVVSRVRPGGAYNIYARWPEEVA